MAQRAVSSAELSWPPQTRHSVHFLHVQLSRAALDVEDGCGEEHQIKNLAHSKNGTVKLHEWGPLLQTAGHPYPLVLGQPSSALSSTAQAGGPPSVEIGWATTKTIIFEDVRGHKMTSFFTC